MTRLRSRRVEWSPQTEVLTAVMTSPLHDAGCRILRSVVQELVSLGLLDDLTIYNVRNNIMIELVEEDGSVR